MLPSRTAPHPLPQPQRAPLLDLDRVGVVSVARWSAWIVRRLRLSGDLRGVIGEQVGCRWGIGEPSPEGELQQTALVSVVELAPIRARPAGRGLASPRERCTPHQLEQVVELYDGE